MSPVEYLNPDFKEASLLAENGYTKPGWYFWDEIWLTCYGPYETKALCQYYLTKYAKSL